MTPSIPSTAITKFYMASPPVGWTKLTSGIDDCAIRVVVGTVTGGGSTPFSTAFTSKAATGTRSMTLATNNTVSGASSHAHASSARYTNGPNSGIGPTGYTHPPTLPAPTSTIYTWPYNPVGASTSATGGGAGHTHTIGVPGTLNGPVTGSPVNFAVNYLDVVLGQRN
jgi:hypothetical protein